MSNKKFENAENSDSIMPNLQLPEPPVEEKETKVEFTQKEVFKEKVALEVQEKDEEVVKRYVGQRGRDKKKRVRKPPSIAQLEHLKRARKAAVEKKRLIREAKEQSKKKDNVEDLKKQWQREYEEKRALEKTVESVPEPKNEILKEVVENKKTPPAPEETEEYNMENFFELMDAWEQRNRDKKEMKPPKPPKAPHQSAPKIQKKPVAQALPQRHPNRNIPQALRPKPPVVRNIFADCF
jgi:hypothetical protein